MITVVLRGENRRRLRSGFELADVDLGEAQNQPKRSGRGRGDVGGGTDAVDGAPPEGSARGQRDIQKHGILGRDGPAFHVSLTKFDDGAPTVEGDRFSIHSGQVRSRDIQEAMQGLAISICFCPLSCRHHIFVPFAKLDDLDAIYKLPFG